MSAQLQAIADELHDDLESLKEALDDAKVLFVAIRKLQPAGDSAHELAHLGVKHADEWSTHAADWIRRAETALYAVDQEAAQ